VSSTHHAGIRWQALLSDRELQRLRPHLGQAPLRDELPGLLAPMTPSMRRRFVNHLLAVLEASPQRASLADAVHRTLAELLEECS
jgi:hypothetical protein